MKGKVRRPRVSIYLPVAPVHVAYVVCAAQHDVVRVLLTVVAGAGQVALPAASRQRPINRRDIGGLALNGPQSFFFDHLVSVFRSRPLFLLLFSTANNNVSRPWRKSSG